MEEIDIATSRVDSSFVDHTPLPASALKTPPRGATAELPRRWPQWRRSERRLLAEHSLQNIERVLSVQPTPSTLVLPLGISCQWGPGPPPKVLSHGHGGWSACRHTNSFRCAPSRPVRHAARWPVRPVILIVYLSPVILSFQVANADNSAKSCTKGVCLATRVWVGLSLTTLSPRRALLQVYRYLCDAQSSLRRV